MESDRCDLSPIHYVSDEGHLAMMAEVLKASKIGLALEGGSLEPRSSAAFCLSWIARPRGKRSSKLEAGKAKK